MRRVILAAIGLALVAGLAWAQAIPGGHEAFVYWWNTTAWTPTSTASPFPVSGTFTPSGTQDINLKQVGGATVDTGHGTASGAQRVELPTDGTGTVGLNAGSNTIGKVGIDQTTPGTTNGVALQPTTSGGLSVFSAIVPNNTTSFVIKASPGQLYGIDGFSIAATTPVWLKIYDAAQGSTTCGSGTPKARYLIPASGGAPGSGLIPSSALGDAYGTAITGCITAGIADNDTTAPAASSYTLNVHYK